MRVNPKVVEAIRRSAGRTKTVGRLNLRGDGCFECACCGETRPDAEWHGFTDWGCHSVCIGCEERYNDQR